MPTPIFRSMLTGSGNFRTLNWKYAIQETGSDVPSTLYAPGAGAQAYGRDVDEKTRLPRQRIHVASSPQGCGPGVTVNKIQR